jgi:scyllo-inositol 2-dehydrogenase (NADP+)
MKPPETNNKLEHSPRINVGIVGFGLSGQFFHAPFLQNHPGFYLQTIVSTGEKAAKLYPKVNIKKDFSALLDDASIHLIVICTPHKFHFEQANQAMLAGKHVVIEKPVALSSMEVKSLMQTSAKTGKQFFPFHNRRFDGDFITIQHLLNAGLLGEVVTYDSHFDRYNPVISRAEWRYKEVDGGGTLFDLGPHLIDQAINLFGKPDSVWCKLYTQRPESKVADGFDLKLFYEGFTASLRAGVMVFEPGLRFQVHGTQGSYIKYGIDPQEGKLRKGLQPHAKDFGNEPEENFGTLRSLNFNDSKKTSWPTASGYYLGFYNNIFECLIQGAQPTISPMDALLNLLIIEGAIQSNAEGRNISMK